MKRSIALAVCLAASYSDAAEIYSADFSAEGVGLEHSTASPPPANGSVPGENWTISWPDAPATDSGGNFFQTQGGALASADWGGIGVFETAAIDVSSLDSAQVSALAATEGDVVFNSAAEEFRWFYKLDGGAEVDGPVYIDDGELNFVQELDVSGASSLVIGFRFNINGGGDGFRVNTVRVDDSVVPSLGISINATFVAENDSNPATTGTVSIETALTEDLVVNLSSGSVDDLTVPESVTILAGQIEAVFDVTVVNDDVQEEVEEISITASAEGFLSASSSLEVESPGLELLFENEFGIQFVEEGGAPLMVSVLLPDSFTEDVALTVVVDDDSEVSVPATLNLTSGSFELMFEIAAVDDADADGVQNITFTVTDPTGNYDSVQGAVAVVDNEPFVAPAIRINEMRIDDLGQDDDEYVEFYSETPDVSLDRLSLVVIGETAAGSGGIDDIYSLSGQSMNGNYFLLGSNRMTFATPDLPVGTDIFENSDNITVLLVSDFYGNFNTDLDLDDLGMLGIQPWREVLDGFALVESAENPPVDTEFEYGTFLNLPVLGPLGGFVPAHVFRSPNATGDWEIGNFGEQGEATLDRPRLDNQGVDPPENAETTITQIVIDQSAGTGQFVFTAATGGGFQVEVSSDLAQADAWSTDEISITGQIVESPVGTYTVNFADSGLSGQAKRFYRVNESSAAQTVRRRRDVDDLVDAYIDIYGAAVIPLALPAQ